MPFNECVYKCCIFDMNAMRMQTPSNGLPESTRCISVWLVGRSARKKERNYRIAIVRKRRFHVHGSHQNILSYENEQTNTTASRDKIEVNKICELETHAKRHTYTRFVFFCHFFCLCTDCFREATHHVYTHVRIHVEINTHFVFGEFADNQDL